MAFYVYILASRRNGTLYIGSTDCLVRRVTQHREGLTPGFTSRYGVKTLVWYEAFETRDDAFRRERQMKVWRRAWKIELIEKTNPGWRDLYPEIC
jgi:putative endonuclease